MTWLMQSVQFTGIDKQVESYNVLIHYSLYMHSLVDKTLDA